MKFAQEESNAEIEYMQNKLESTQKSFIDFAQCSIGSVKEKLRQLQSNQLKPQPKNVDQQPNIVPPDIMYINTVNKTTTATSISKITLTTTTVLKQTRSKTIHFNETFDIREIEYRSKTRMNTAKPNTTNIVISNEINITYRN